MEHSELLPLLQFPPAHFAIATVFVLAGIFGSRRKSSAVASQKRNHCKEALDELTKAIEVSSIPKRVCQVGCVSTSILQTPALYRRAYAHVKCDVDLQDYLGQRVDASEAFCAIRQAFGVTVEKSLFSIHASVFPAESSPFQKGIM